MRALALLAVLAATSMAQDVKIKGRHEMIPLTASPVTVTLEGEFDHVAFWMEGASSTVHNGNSCTFQASPGVRKIRVYGMRWFEGVLKPVVKGTHHILIIEPQSTPEDDPAEWGEPGLIEPYPKLAKAPPAEPTETKSVYLPYAGVTIEMRTDSLEQSSCIRCVEWWNQNQQRYADKGALVRKVAYENGPWPQFRVLYGGKRTLWTDETMTPEFLLASLEELRKEK